MPGRDSGITPFATWVPASRELRLSGVAGGELVIEEAVLVDVKATLARAEFVVARTDLPEALACELEILAGDRVVGRLDLRTASERLVLHTLQEGAVLGVGLRLRLKEGAHGSRHVIVAWEVKD